MKVLRGKKKKCSILQVAIETIMAVNVQRCAIISKDANHQEKIPNQTSIFSSMTGQYAINCSGLEYCVNFVTVFKKFII